MAQNSIGYEGRIVVTKNAPLKFTRTKAGMFILEMTLAENHSMKKGRAKKDPALKRFVEDDRNKSKGDDDWIDTTTSWHRLTVFGDKAEAYATDEDFNNGALVIVENASYTEEGEWETKDGVKRAGRPETIGDQKGSLEIKFAPKEAQPAIWDGESPVPEPGGSGGAAKEYGENEGF